MTIQKLYDTAAWALSRGSDYGKALRAIENLAEAVDGYEEELDGADSLLVGAYWYCRDYSGGRGSDEHRLQCVIGEFFSPGSLDRDSAEFGTYADLAVLAGHGDWDSIYEEAE